jgi:hypothetical protein
LTYSAFELEFKDNNLIFNWNFRPWLNQNNGVKTLLAEDVEQFNFWIENKDGFIQILKFRFCIKSYCKEIATIISHL